MSNKAKNQSNPIETIKLNAQPLGITESDPKKATGSVKKKIFEKNRTDFINYLFVNSYVNFVRPPDAV